MTSRSRLIHQHLSPPSKAHGQADEEGDETDSGTKDEWVASQWTMFILKATLRFHSRDVHPAHAIGPENPFRLVERDQHLSSIIGLSRVIPFESSEVIPEWQYQCHHLPCCTESLQR